MALLDELEPEDRSILLSLQQPRALEKGTVLFRQGDPAETAVFIRSGELALELYAPGLASPVSIDTGRGGDLLGEPALVMRGVRSRTAVAATDTEIGIIHRADLRSMLSTFHPASMRIVLAVARQVAGRLQTTAAVSSDAAPLSGRPGVRPSAIDPRPYLPKLPFFHSFTGMDIDALLALGTLWDVERGTPIVAEGQRSDRCFLVVRGAVEVRQGGQRVGLLGPGRPAGEMAPLTGNPTAADLVMRETGTLLELGPDAFAALTSPEHRVAFKFTNALATTLVESLARTNRHTAREALQTAAPHARR